MLNPYNCTNNYYNNFVFTVYTFGICHLQSPSKLIVQDNI